MTRVPYFAPPATMAAALRLDARAPTATVDRRVTRRLGIDWMLRAWAPGDIVIVGPWATCVVDAGPVLHVVAYEEFRRELTAVNEWFAAWTAAAAKAARRKR